MGGEGHESLSPGFTVVEPNIWRLLSSCSTVELQFGYFHVSEKTCQSSVAAGAEASRFINGKGATQCTQSSFLQDIAQALSGSVDGQLLADPGCCRCPAGRVVPAGAS